MKNGCCDAATEVRNCERALVARRVVARGRHEAAVVVGDAAAHLGQALVGAGVGRVPPREPVVREVRRGGGGAGRLAAVPLALVDDVVPRGGHDRRDVRQEAERQLHLRVGRRLHVRLERVLHPVLVREVARHEGGAGGRAHARVREGVLEGHAVARELGQPRQVLLGPPEREMLDGPLLVGDEHHHVHPGEARGDGSGRAPGACREAPEPHGARRRRRSPEELPPGDVPGRTRRGSRVTGDDGNARPQIPNSEIPCIRERSGPPVTLSP